jgi:hypothetical protein
MVLLALTMALGGAGCGSDASSDGKSDDAAPIGEVVDLSSPGFHELLEPPIDGGESATRVWTGEELVLWGGIIPADDSAPGVIATNGATLDLTDGRWTEMAPSPFDDGLYHPLGAFDGDEVIFIGTQCDGEVPSVTVGGSPTCPKGPAAAAWSPETRTWRELPVPPIPLDKYSDERVVEGMAVAVGGPGAALFSFGFDVTTIAWDRATETWRTIEAPWSDPTAVAMYADRATPQLVAVEGYLSNRSEVDPATLWTMAAGDDSWAAVGEHDLGEVTLSVGENALVTSGSPSNANAGHIIDLRSGDIAETLEPDPPDLLRSPTAVGPWLFSTTELLDEQDDYVEVRRIDGGEWQRLEGLTSWSRGAYVGDGLVGYVFTEGKHTSTSFGYWRAPPELLD